MLQKYISVKKFSSESLCVSFNKRSVYLLIEDLFVFTLIYVDFYIPEEEDESFLIST